MADKLTERLTFVEGRKEDRTMVSKVSATIGGEWGSYVVLCNAIHNVKPHIEYVVELIPMKSGKGFIVTKATEVRDIAVVQKHDVFPDLVCVFVKRFGEEAFDQQPTWIYDRRHNLPYSEQVDKIKQFTDYRYLRLSEEGAKNLIETFEKTCKEFRAGGVGKEIEDEITYRLEGDKINIYLRRSYEQDFGVEPILSYEANQSSWESMVDELESMFSKGAIIMPEFGFDAFLDDLIFVCKKREKEVKKEFMKSAKRVTEGFTKKVKIVDGEYVTI